MVSLLPVLVKQNVYWTIMKLTPKIPDMFITPKKKKKSNPISYGKNSRKKKKRCTLVLPLSVYFASEQWHSEIRGSQCEHSLETQCSNRICAEKNEKKIRFWSKDFPYNKSRVHLTAWNEWLKLVEFSVCLWYFFFAFSLQKSQGLSGT